MILVYESESWGLVHVPFNAAFLEIIRTAFPSEKIIFCCEQSHLKHVMRQITPQVVPSISWKKVMIPPRRAKAYQRFLSDFKMLRALLNMLNEDTQGTLILTSNNTSTLLAVKTHLKFFHRKKNAQVVLHAELGELNLKRSRNPIIQMKETNTQTALRIGCSGRVRYLVLEESIKEELLRRIPSISKLVDVFDHPIPPKEAAKDTFELCEPFRFGFLGLANESKGFPIYLKLASEISTKFPKGVEFHAIGRIHPSLKTLNMDFLNSKPSLQQLSRNQFVDRLKKIHFVCFPYQKKQYELTASGALLDAIAWEKPIIALKLPIFENLFRRFGDIGYLCNNEAEFHKTVEQIIERADVTRYRNQVVSIRRVRHSRSTKSLVSKYQKIFEKLKC